MLKKNIKVPSSELHLSNTIAVQTDEFLLYLSIEDKLSNLLEEYKALDTQNQKKEDLLEYYEFKNAILENSLHELTFAFNNKMGLQKINLIDEIAQLDKIIEREKQDVEEFQRMIVSEICFEGKSKVSKESERETSKEKQIRSGKSKQREILQSDRGIVNKKRRDSLNLLEQQSLGQRSSRTMHESHNQFLELRQKCPNIQQQSQLFIPNQTLKKRNKDPPKLSLEKKKSSKIKDYKANVDKQNKIVEKMVKRQAELNLKAFLTNFESANSDRIRKHIQ